MIEMHSLAGAMHRRQQFCRAARSLFVASGVVVIVIVVVAVVAEAEAEAVASGWDVDVVVLVAAAPATPAMPVPGPDAALAPPSAVVVSDAVAAASHILPQLYLYFCTFSLLFRSASVRNRLYVADAIATAVALLTQFPHIGTRVPFHSLLERS